MAGRTYDVTIFGASGFTGQWIAVALARASAEAGGAVRVALAGRDASRLRAVEARVRAEVPAFTGDVGIIVADARNEDALLEMARGTRVVIAAAGPFRFFGEPVVRACIAAGTNYVDITGEPEFMERMELEYGDAAKRAGEAPVERAARVRAACRRSSCTLRAVSDRPPSCIQACSTSPVNPPPSTCAH
jgi:short subunit dehydrogenase-like uncharacterized protein